MQFKMPTQGHSILNLRNTLPVWWRYELCEDPEASQCTLNAVKTGHFITKYFAFKSSYVCNMVKYVVEIIVVRFNCCLRIACFWYKIKLARFKMARNVEKLWGMLLIWCYAWCLVISKTWGLIVFKFNQTVQAIVFVFCDII